MAKQRSPKNQIKDLPEYGELQSIMQDETASIVTDYIRQYVGVIQGRGYDPRGQKAIYMNQDRVQRYQTYQELAFYDLYAEVERDNHIKAVLDSAKYNVAGMKWDVSAYVEGEDKTPTARNKEIAAFTKMALKKTGHFPQHIYNLMGALGMGFSVSEVIWEITDDGILVKEILNRPQRRFQFDAVDRTLKVRNLEEPYYGIPLPEKKFIVHRCSSQWDIPFGDALDQSLYWMWLFKKTAIKFYLQHLEVGAASVPIVQHPANASKEFKTEMLAVAQMIRKGAYGRLPENCKLIWAESNNAQGIAEAYNTFVRLMNDEISKCVNGQTLTAEASGGNNKGSFATAKVHAGTQSARDVFRAEALAATLNATLIKWLVDFNFSSVDGYPEFRFDLEEPDDLVKESTIVKTLADAGFDFDEEELSEKFNYTLKKKEPLQLDPAKNPNDNKPAEDSADEENKESVLENENATSK